MVAGPFILIRQICRYNCKILGFWRTDNIDCPISRVKTQKQAAMAALIFGIILYYVAVEYDRTNICRCNQSVRSPQLADRVWQKMMRFRRSFGLPKELSRTLSPYSADIITKRNKLASTAMPRPLILGTQSPPTTPSAKRVHPSSGRRGVNLPVLTGITPRTVFADRSVRAPSDYIPMPRTIPMQNADSECRMKPRLRRSWLQSWALFLGLFHKGRCLMRLCHSLSYPQRMVISSSSIA